MAYVVSLSTGQHISLHIQYLCETVGVYFGSKGPPKLSPTFACKALSLTSSAKPFSLEVADFKEFVFLLVDLWGLDGDIVRKQWACAFFAAGLADQGKEVWLTWIVI